MFSVNLPNLQDCKQQLDKSFDRPLNPAKPFISITVDFNDDETVAEKDLEICKNIDCPKIPNSEEIFCFANSFEEFKEILQEHEIKTVTKYVFAFGTKNFSKAEIMLNSRLKLHWQKCMPYFHFGARTYICHQGKDLNLYQKKKYMKQKKQRATLENSELTYKIQPSKKNSCKARVTLVRMYQLPKYQIIGKLTKKRKTIISSLIRGRIARGEQVKGVEKYYFNLPGTGTHQNHKPDEMIEPVDDRVRNYISALVYQGHKDPKEVAELLEVFVTTQLKPNNMIRRRFYPDISTIKRIMVRTENCIGDFDISSDDIEILIIS